MSLQLDLFGTAPAVSRWPGDGPHPSTVWRDDGTTTIRRFYDGVGWCQALCAQCRRCGVWHPLDLEFGTGKLSSLHAMRCPGGAGWVS